MFTMPLLKGRSRRHSGRVARTQSRTRPRARRLRHEPLEDRRLLSVSYPNFSDSTGLNLVGDAAIADGNILRLTPAVGGMEGAAWYGEEKQFVSVDWETTFDFNLNENFDEPGGSDGFVFIVQNTDPTYLAGGGGPLGYNNLSNSLAVEFDTFQNSEASDPSQSHISVHTNGIGPNGWDEALSLGSYSTLAIMDDAATHNVKISYTPGELDVFFDDLANPVLTVSVDLADTLNLDAGRAWVGFTATTGGGYQNHDILSWQYDSFADTNPVIAIDNGEQIEGNLGDTQFIDLPVTVIRPDATNPLTVQVTYATADDTANSSAGDYVPIDSTTLTFNLAAGQADATQFIQVTVNGDELEEAHETFSVDLSSPVGAFLADGQGVGTILNDDTSISIDDVTVTEGDDTPRFIDAFVPANGGGLDEPQAIAFGPDGNLYVSGQGSDDVLRYDAATGDLIDEFVPTASGGLENPRAFAFGPDGNLYVASAATSSVIRYQGPSGANPGQFVDTFVPTASGGLDQPMGVTFGSDGNLYVATRGLGNSVLRYQGPDGTSPGAFIDAFVPGGSGGLGNPRSLLFGVDGNLYVSSGTDSVLRYQGPSGTDPGEFIDAFVPTASGGLDSPHGLAFGPDGRLYVGSRTGNVLRYNGTTGAFIGEFVPTGEGGLANARELAFGLDGNLYVASKDTDQVLRYGVASQAVFTVSLSSPSAEQVTVDFNTADGTATAGSDYAATSGIVVFDPGVTTRTIIVPTVDDIIPEDDETFVVNLSNPSSGATVMDSQGVATIIDTDGPLFSDSFENGEWDGKWVEDSQYDWFDSTQRKTDGNYSAEVDGRATDATLTMTNPIDMTPYGSAELTFDWYIESGFDSGEYLALDFSPDGSTWTEIERLRGNVDQENTWHNETIDIDPAYLTGGFKIRFRAYVSGSREDANVDNVQLFATSLAVPPNYAPVAGNDGYSVTEDGSLNVSAPGVLADDTDADGDSLSAVLYAGPANGSLTLNSDGSFTYDPEADFNGTDSFVYRAFDGTDYSNTATVTITVDPINDVPVATGDAYTGDQDTILTVAAPGVLGNDSDIDGDPLSAILDTGPGHGVLHLGADGSFDYTPNAGFFGSDSFTYKANDGQELSAAATVSITVNRVNNAPVAVDDSYATDEDTGLSVGGLGVLVNDTDGEDDPLSAVLVNGPTDGSLTLNPDGSFTYDPDTNFNGTDTFTYMANDGIDDSNVATVTITVNSVNDVPVAVADGYSVAEDGGLNLTAPGVLGNDSDVDEDSLTASLVTGPASGGLTLNPDGSFTYTPTANFHGNDGFTYEVSDGQGGTDQAAVSLTVTSVNDPPVAVDDSATTNEDNAVVIAVLTNDTDVEGSSLSVVPGSGPANGSLVFNPNGTVTYTPNSDFNGTDSFTYRANDGTDDSNVATVSITVNSENDAPVGVNDAYSVDQDASLTVTAPGVLANDTDVENDPLTAALVAGPSNGSLSLNADGSFNYTPTAGFSGSDSFTYEANDGTDDSNVATVSITVNPLATGPMLRKGVVTANTGDWVTVTLDRSYTSMVVVLTPNYSDADAPMVARLQNASGNSFQVKLDRADGQTGSTSEVFGVHYMVVEEGVYTEAKHGVTMEAVKYTSTVTDENNSWVGEARVYQQAYSQPVVVGQVMTDNDAWSVFWACGASRTAPPSASALKVGKMVGEDPDATRADETIGYVVVESGTWTLDGESFVAGLGADTIKGVDDAPAYTYSFAELPSITAAVASQAAMDGGNGGWAVLYGNDPVSTTTINLAVDEDRMKDSERKHTSEQVAFIVFDPSVETAAAADQVLAQGVDTSAVSLYLADLTNSDDRAGKEKKDKANDLALLLMMQ